MRTNERLALGSAVIGALLGATVKGVEELHAAIRDLTDEQAIAGLATLAKIHATATRGDVRFIPADGLAEDVLDAADEAGFVGAFRVADAITTNDVRAALGNLSWAMWMQTSWAGRAAQQAPLN